MYMHSRTKDISTSDKYTSRYQTTQDIRTCIPKDPQKCWISACPSMKDFCVDNSVLFRVPVNWETEKKRKETKRNGKKKNEKKTRRNVTKRNEKNETQKNENKIVRKETKQKKKKKKEKNVKKRNEMKSTEARR